MKDIVEGAYVSHKPKNCAVYMNSYCIIFTKCSLRCAFAKVQKAFILFNFKYFVWEYVGTDYFVYLNVGGKKIRHTPNLQS